jgi:glycosyltransferase involved in cell wall biosynthesis
MSPVHVVVAHPSPDLYGSDRQLLVTVAALRAAGCRVTVLVPEDGPLIELLRGEGAVVEVAFFPVLRKSLLSPRALVRLALDTVVTSLRGGAALRRLAADLVLVNTLTMPCWLVAGRLAGLPVLSHVHEAEEEQPTWVRRLLAGQLVLAHQVVVNSAAARRAVVDVVPALAGRTKVIHNGVPGPPTPPATVRQRRPEDLLRIVLVARLSPRKGVDVALDAVGALRCEGRAVSLDVCGTVFPGYEWYQRELSRRAALPDLAGAVAFRGYVCPTWPVLEDADVVLVPSRAEPFGNTAVEAMHAARPVVASAVQGLLEVVRHGTTGLLVEAGDPAALADAIRHLADHPEDARTLAAAGHEDAAERFSTERYAAAVIETIQTLLGRALEQGSD